jgi:hypothetical protein
MSIRSLTRQHWKSYTTNLRGLDMNMTQKAAVEASLSNDETSSDAELLEYFMTELRLSEHEAKKAIALRGRYLTGEDHLI